MTSKNQGVPLQELVDLYEGEQVQNNEEVRQNMLLKILTHDEIKSCLKNQALILKKIFTHRHLTTLIQFLKQENPEHAQQLKGCKYDPSGENIPLCMKLPFMAMEILCCECHHINDILFTGSESNPEPLLPKLLQFLDQPQHYHLACYFSKVISAITKRVSSASHKFNIYFAQCVFGDSQSEQSIRKSCLFKSIRHFYSLSTHQYIMKWLLMSTKQTVKIEDDDFSGKVTQKTIVSFKKPLKMKFLNELLKIVNKNMLEQQIITNIASLFEQMLSNPSKAKKIPTLNFKAFGTNLQQPKVTLYDLAAQQQIIVEAFEVPEQGCLTIAKINLIKVFLNRYILELQSLTKQKNDDEEQERKLLQIVNSQNFMYLFEWIIQHLKLFLKLTTRDISSQNSAHIQEQTIQNNHVTLNSSQKMLVLQLCEIVRIIHGLDSCKIQLIQYYNEHSSTLVTLIKRLMSLQNNLIQLQLSKIVLSMIKPQAKGISSNVPHDFARKLLLHSVLELIQISSAKAHVIEWADILLLLENSHIFQDSEEEFEWQHIREIVEQAKQIHIGQYKLVQANIDCLYSQQKARLKYSHFLDGFTAQIQYEGKKPATEKKISQKSNESKQEPQQEDGESSEATLFFLGDSNSSYLKYNVDDLIQEL